MRVRLFGGFEVWCGDRQVGGFESQKVRALLAYLISHRGRSFSRDHLAELLWPERNPESARHVLRQSIYDLRSKLPGGDSPAPPILSTSKEVRFNPQSDYWFDVEAFEEALRKAGQVQQGADPHHLVTAVQLYRGEFLAGFSVDGGEGFEDWLVAEQERLREAAIEALRALIDSYRRRGEYRYGIHYARRLIAIDPLSEEAHRDLIRLFALSGRRGQALSQYEELKDRLRRELGVAPLEETRALYETILLDPAATARAAAEDTEPVAPLIPLVGRGEAYVVLEECWQRVLGGSGQLTLVEGELGVGKTRLIKSFLDTAAGRQQAVVLRGRCYELAPPGNYRPFVEALRGAFAQEDVADLALSGLPGEVLEDVARLLPEIRELRPEPPVATPLAGPGERERLFASMARFVEALGQTHVGEEPRPVVLFLDALHLADAPALDLLGYLARRLAQAPLWIIAAYRSAGFDPEHPFLAIAREREAVWLGIGRLDRAAVDEVAQSLVGEGEAMELARFLDRHSGGLPLALTELVNFLWDEGVLVAQEARSWRLARPLAEVQVPEGDDLAALTLRRIRRLPNSTRRLAALAAMIGHHFEADLLQHAADEHPTVVEVGLEILLQRWLVRQSVLGWASGRLERDIVLWMRGARRGSFEFAHEHIRSALYYDLNPLRRQAMHGQIAAALEELRRERREVFCEALAYHYMAAGQWERALPCLEQAAEKALALLAKETALDIYEQELEAVGRLVASARTREQADRWGQERLRIQRLRDALV